MRYWFELSSTITGALKSASNWVDYIRFRVSIQEKFGLHLAHFHDFSITRFFYLQYVHVVCLVICYTCFWLWLENLCGAICLVYLVTTDILFDGNCLVWLFRQKLRDNGNWCPSWVPGTQGLTLSNELTLRVGLVRRAAMMPRMIRIKTNVVPNRTCAKHLKNQICTFFVKLSNLHFHNAG